MTEEQIFVAECNRRIFLPTPEEKARDAQRNFSFDSDRTDSHKESNGDMVGHPRDV